MAITNMIKSVKGFIGRVFKPGSFVVRAIEEAAEVAEPYVVTAIKANLLSAGLSMSDEAAAELSKTIINVIKERI